MIYYVFDGDELALQTSNEDLALETYANIEEDGGIADMEVEYGEGSL